MALPPLPAIGSCIIEVFGPDTDSASWDNAQWDGSSWARLDWSDVTPQSMTMQLNWGADDPAGVLSTPAAGTWSINTYDPQRRLDPSNGSTPLASSIKPGRPMRISYKRTNGELVTIRRGLIDTIKYDLASATGSVTGTDDIQVMVGAKLPEGQHLDLNVPNTLRARTEYLLKKAGLQNIILVEGSGGGYSSRVAEFRPLGYWRMDDALPALMDDKSGNNNDGQYTGAVTLGQPPLVSGGKSALFAGGHSEVPASANFGANWSIEFWMMVNALPAAPAFIVDRASNNAPTIWLSPAGLIVASRDGSATQAATSTTPLSLALPHHVLVTHDPNNVVRIYIDGVDETITVAPLVTTGAAPAPIRIAFSFAGYLDEVAIYPSTLSAEVAAAHYAYGAGTLGLYDPPVGPVIENEATVWAHILTAALDALYAVWMDRLGVMRFRSFGNPQDTGLQIGGADGIAIDTLATEGSLQQVYTKITAFDVDAPDVEVSASDPIKAQVYGELLLHRDAPVPDAAAWVEAVLADRSGSGLTYTPQTMRIQTEEQLLAVIALGMIDIVNVVVESVNPTINVAARVLGAVITADTEAGWNCKVLTYIPAIEWEQATEPTPPEPPVIPPPNTTQVVRTYTCTKDARLAHSGSLDAGSGVDNQIFVGYTGGYRNRMVADFQDIPWGDVVEVVKAELLLTTSSETCGSFGSAPKVYVDRITQSWSEGSYDAACGFATSNSVKYPGPTATSSGRVTRSVTTSENTSVSVDITAIARSWFGGSSQHGLRIISAGEDSSKYSTEFWSRHQGTASKRPQLKLTLKVAV